MALPDRSVTSKDVRSDGPEVMAGISESAKEACRRLALDPNDILSRLLFFRAQFQNFLTLYFPNDFAQRAQFIQRWNVSVHNLDEAICRGRNRSEVEAAIYYQFMMIEGWLGSIRREEDDLRIAPMVQRHFATCMTSLLAMQPQDFDSLTWQTIVKVTITEREREYLAFITGNNINLNEAMQKIPQVTHLYNDIVGLTREEIIHRVENRQRVDRIVLCEPILASETDRLIGLLLSRAYARGYKGFNISAVKFFVRKLYEHFFDELKKGEIEERNIVPGFLCESSDTVERICDQMIDYYTSKDSLRN